MKFSVGRDFFDKKFFRHLKILVYMYNEKFELLQVESNKTITWVEFVKKNFLYLLNF